MNQICEKLQELRAHADELLASDSWEQAEREALQRLATQLKHLVRGLERVVAATGLRT